MNGSCVGPVAIPPELTCALRGLVRTEDADDLVPLAICAAMLVRRLPVRGAATRASVIRGSAEVVTPSSAESAEPAGPAVSFRAALRDGARFQVPGARHVDVTILVSEDIDRFYVDSTTSSGEAPTAQCWAATFLHLLSRMVTEPDVAMLDHPLIDGADFDRVLRGGNSYHVPETRHRTMAGPFEEQAHRTPDADALLDEHGVTVSYRQLNERANRLAHFLIGTGAGPGTRIGICMAHGIDQVVAIYAAVKTGAAYVPLDADLPDTRIAYLLEDSAPGHVLTDEACRTRIPGGAWHCHVVGAGSTPWADCQATNPVVAGTPSSLLHILYTSGTTGRPKGVAYPTDAALANLGWMQYRYPFGDNDSAVYKTSPGFDVSIWELFWPLHHGARLVICRPGGHRDPAHLATLVADHGVTTIFLVPTMMTPFLEKVPAARAAALRWALCGGESMAPRLVHTFYATLPDSTLVNAFGPTEAGPVTDNIIGPDLDDTVVPVGRAADNFRLTVLDENLSAVPIGMPGEAYICGHTGLAQGYWGAPGRTAERFVADPYGPPGSRMYRTGDLCRYREDGALEHLGRIDRQIKIRGQRVEPGELESVLAAHPAVGDCAVIAHGDPVRLLAFVVPAGGWPMTAADTAAVLAHVAATLPDHLRPARVVPVQRIPATVNGKIDKDELVRVWVATAHRERQIVPPADDLEATLVEIYGRILDTAPVSVLDTFVALGGHSLLAFQLLDDCDARLSAKPDVTKLLNGTVRDVAASIRGARRDPHALRPDHDGGRVRR